MLNRDEIWVSEMFYSIQGEGITLGTPAIFLRLRGCNLLCDGTWTCDTIPVWKKGDPYRIEALLELWKKNGFINHLQSGAVLVITGGEPLLQKEGVFRFLQLLKAALGSAIERVEIETNGTINPLDEIDQLTIQYNISPKLGNSGQPMSKRVNPRAIHELLAKESVVFKFVVHSEADVLEALDTYVKPFKINAKNICLMPGADTKNKMEKLESEIIELCKKYHFRYSTRLHIVIWDKKTGV